MKRTVKFALAIVGILALYVILRFIALIVVAA
jgi:hypothetical protein